MRLLIAGVFLGAAIVSAQAADLPAKAPPSTPFLTGYTGSGFYAGFNFRGAAGTVDATIPTAPGVQTITQANGQMGITLGYAKALGNGSWIAIEGDFDVMGTSGNTLQGLSLNGPMAFDQRLIYGGGIFDIF